MSIIGASLNFIAVCYGWVDECVVKVYLCCFLLIYGLAFIVIDIPIPFATLVLTYLFYMWFISRRGHQPRTLVLCIWVSVLLFISMFSLDFFHVFEKNKKTCSILLECWVKVYWFSTIKFNVFCRINTFHILQHFPYLVLSPTYTSLPVW